jgi:hypothetical protein
MKVIGIVSKTPKLLSCVIDLFIEVLDGAIKKAPKQNSDLKPIEKTTVKTIENQLKTT